jgi:amidase
VVHPAHKAAARRCGEVLTALGHDVGRADPKYPLWLIPAMIGRWFIAPVDDSAARLTGTGIEPRTLRHIRAGRLTARLRRPSPANREKLRAALDPFFERYDVLVLPALAWTCPRARRRGEGSWLASVFAALRFSPMTGPWNVAGYPAAVVPVGEYKGMPGSAQLVASPGREATLLAVAAQIERAAGWRRHAPHYDPAR